MQNDANLKVLSVCTSDSSGGAARAAYRIHQAVRNLSVDSQMFVKNKGTNDPTVLVSDIFLPHNILYRGFDWGCNKIKNKWQQHIWNKYPEREDYYMSDLRSTNIGGALKKIDYDVLHLHWVNQRFIPFKQLPRHKPIIWTLHDSWPFCGICHYFLNCSGFQACCGKCPHLSSNESNDLSNRIWKRKEHYYQRLNLHVVAPSNWLGICARQSSLFRHSPISVIPNCVDNTLFRCLKDNELSPRWEYLKKRKHKKAFVLFGAMNATTDKIKGYEYLLSALSLLRQADRAAFELIVFGANRPIDALSDIIPTHFVGSILDNKELVSLYNLASVLVVPSLTENLSCAIMESMSCATPVVAFDVGGNSDLIDHKINGYLARERNVEDLALGILWCLNHNTYQQLSINARKKVLESFSPEKVGALYKDLYFSLRSTNNH